MRSEYGSDGSLIWSTIYELPPASLSSIEIVTDSYEEKTEYGAEPDIVPMGINSCSATMSGQFMRKVASGNKLNASYPFPAGNLSPVIVSSDDLFPLFVDISGNTHVFAIQRTATGTGGRDLGSGIWRIDKFVFDRDSNNAGIFRFNMVLGYVWTNPLEQQIFYGNTGVNKKQTCKFQATITPSDNDQDELNAVEIFNTKITKSLYVKNTAKFDYTVNIFKNSFVLIGKMGATSDSESKVFLGIVTDCENNRDGTFTVSCKEVCDLLYRGVCSQGGLLGALFPKVIIPNPDAYTATDLTIDQILNKILQYYKAKTGYERFVPGYIGNDRTHGLGGSIYLPGHDSDTESPIKISTQVMSCMSVGTAVTNFLYQQCGFNIWYNYNTNGTIEYGYIRDRITIDITKEVIEKSELISTNNEETVPDGVMVWDSAGEYNGSYGDIDINKHVLVYVMTDSKFDGALNAIAERIFKLYDGIDLSSYSVRFPAGTVRFKEGDYFDGLGDETVSDRIMEYREGTDVDPLEDPTDAVWQIKELTITEQSTTVTVGSSYVSVLDIYRGVLNKNKDGIPAPVENKVLQSKPIVVGRAT
ncbi:MAG: hypothetical protein M0R80_09980 [Proteobacteria bacterium]|jgi:hypothetical protein|nr:hypothetical protein [Pseudomonadota bacterium]